jgi:hypothetical protein
MTKPSLTHDPIKVGQTASNDLVDLVEYFLISCQGFSLFENAHGTGMKLFYDVSHIAEGRQGLSLSEQLLCQLYSCC